VTWNWWINSDAGLAARVAVGVAVLAALAAWDLHRHGRRATRWREYLFLVACVAVALVYGALNDQVTTTVSWEYFAYGKGVAEALPPGEPPNSAAFRWEAAKVGMRATWSAGLIVGVALLIANNPRRDGRPRLSYARLFGCLPLVFGVVIVAVICLGVAGYAGAFLPVNEDFREMLRQDQWRPRRFMAVFGMHLGGYAGGVVGTVLAVIRVNRARRRAAQTQADQPLPARPGHFSDPVR
jgi:hypothetical protein